MDVIIWPMLNVCRGSPKDFVRFWEELYSGYDEDFYQENISRPLTKERIAEWFAWKNGTSLSAKKLKTVRRNFSPEEAIERDADAGALSAFLNRPGGAIWRVFWLH